MSREFSEGPWHWNINRHCHRIELRGRRNLVMDFVRYGMQHAAPRLTRDGLFYRADEFAVDISGQEHNAHWNQAISHPDARLIATAPELYAELEKHDPDNPVLARARGEGVDG